MLDSQIIKELSEHNHEPDEELVKARKTYMTMKRTAASSQLEPVSSIMSENVGGLSTAACAKLPKIESIQNRLYKIRQAENPHPPAVIWADTLEFPARDFNPAEYRGMHSKIR